jgi:hypothetical protein
MRSSSATATRSRSARLAASFVLAFAMLLGPASVSTAEDVGSLSRTLGSASDFRVRVNAALALGKTHNRAALAPLVAALLDPQPAVRAAAAAAIGALGQRDGMGALRGQLAGERIASVRSEIGTAMEILGAARLGSSKGTKYFVQLGMMRNNSGVRGSELAETFRGVTRERASVLPGVVVLTDEGVEVAQAQKTPMLVMDGVVNRLVRGSRGQNLTVSAQVEYVVRRAPDQSLKGTVSGAAEASDAANVAGDRRRVSQLENQALQGAVDSALRGAPALLKQAMH